MKNYGPPRRTALLMLGLVLGACAQGSETPTDPPVPPIPFQGPKNPNFETADSWVFASTNSSGCNLSSSGDSRARIVTGTGFLPSRGVQYAEFFACNTFTAPQASAYQDSVDFTHSSTLDFDYSCTGSLGAGGGTATARILFTSNGTATLWTKTIDASSSLPAQKLGESITLPSTAAAGRLSITFNVVGGQVPPNNITQSRMTFAMDNLIVK